MLEFLRNNRDLALIGTVIVILMVLFAPIPPVLLDLAIIVNLGFGLTILLLTFYVKKPIDFSTFPSLLLITTLLRLSLNVAATRLILTGADAGEVIGSIGAFAVSGNFVVGLVVFLILIVVQYVVVTSGAQRVSEVAARFTLDSMPGQQMSIDADLNMGLIDPKEAIRRREALEKQAAFYGSMDGASKFVKGDAIAGVIIILIDIIAGWIIGVAQMGMDWDEALRTFSLLTIGDGIATQIPALVIAIATGIIVTRSSADRELSTEVFKQLLSVRRIPLVVGSILLVMLLLPGMPKWPILIILALFGYAWLHIRDTAEADQDLTASDEAEGETTETLTKSFPAIEIALGVNIAEAWADKRVQLLERLANLRDSHANQTGLSLPKAVFIDDKSLKPDEYQIRIFGTAYSDAELFPDQFLAIRSDKSTDGLSGKETRDAAFGLPAVWIDQSTESFAREKKYSVIDPVTVLITHLSEIIRINSDALLTRATTTRLLEEVRERQSGLVEELLPNLLTVSDVQKVLKNLLREGVSIENIDQIVEHLVDLARQEKSSIFLTEAIRQRMGLSICNSLKNGHKELAVLSLDPKIENQIKSAMANTNAEPLFAVDPSLTQKLIETLASLSTRMHGQGRTPVLLCGAEIRRHVRSLTERSVPQLSILSIAEIPKTIELSSFDVVRV
ncbi:flagellar biosynthesis protein FlhA [Ponticaulis koreensis]|uniref:flagellar biosynthesis protein FlhA n=1 Tax=Ponticaulis koreensis TaxID=1123045 RepID=UPI0003B3565A|nr:flagellar biosynthesis protein FlhA [Ponticaulis koreensis]